MLTYDLDRRGKLARYDYLYRCIREDILAGRLTAGEKLPSKRSLASHLQTAVITVQNAYAQLEAEGYLYTREKRGYYVADVERHPAAPGAPRPKRAAAAALVAARSQLRRQRDGGLSLFRVGKAHAPRAERGGRGAAARHAAERRGRAAQGHRRSISTASAASPPRPEQIVVGAGTEYLYNLIVQLLGREAVYGVEDPATPRPRASTRSAAQGLRRACG